MSVGNACIGCEAGSYAPQGAIKCIVCGSGSFSGAAADRCSLSPRNFIFSVWCNLQRNLCGLCCGIVRNFQRSELLLSLSFRNCLSSDHVLSIQLRRLRAGNLLINRGHRIVL